jgi:hypothetical protein
VLIIAISAISAVAAIPTTAAGTAAITTCISTGVASTITSRLGRRRAVALPAIALPAIALGLGRWSAILLVLDRLPLVASTTAWILWRGLQVAVVAHLLAAVRAIRLRSDIALLRLIATVQLFPTVELLAIAIAAPAISPIQVLPHHLLLVALISSAGLLSELFGAGGLVEPEGRGAEVVGNVGTRLASILLLVIRAIEAGAVRVSILRFEFGASVLVLLHLPRTIHRIAAFVISQLPQAIIPTVAPIPLSLIAPIRKLTSVTSAIAVTAAIAIVAVAPIIAS